MQTHVHLGQVIKPAKHSNKMTRMTHDSVQRSTVGGKAAASAVWAETELHSKKCRNISNDAHPKHSPGQGRARRRRPIPSDHSTGPPHPPTHSCLSQEGEQHKKESGAAACTLHVSHSGAGITRHWIPKWPQIWSTTLNT